MSEVDLKKFFLEQVRLFENFPPTRSTIVIQSRLTTFEGNEAILETGDEAVHRRRDQRPRRNLGDRQHRHPHRDQPARPGDVFGVMSTLTGDRMSADVIAGNRCFVLLIPRRSSTPTS
jgi:acetate kinase